MRSYRSTASFGKRQEFVVIGELLRRGFDVYQTLVDDQGIDCIVRQQRGDEIRLRKRREPYLPAICEQARRSGPVFAD